MRSQQKIQHSASFEQQLKGDKYYFIAKIDGQELLNKQNPDPKEYENMILNGPLGNRPQGEIKQIRLSGIDLSLHLLSFTLKSIAHRLYSTSIIR